MSKTAHETNTEGKISCRLGEDLDYLKGLNKEHKLSVSLIASTIIKRGVRELKSGAWKFAPDELIVSSTESTGK